MNWLFRKESYLPMKHCKEKDLYFHRSCPNNALDIPRAWKAEL